MNNEKTLETSLLEDMDFGLKCIKDTISKLNTKLKEVSDGRTIYVSTIQGEIDIELSQLFRNIVKTNSKLANLCYSILR